MGVAGGGRYRDRSDGGCASGVFLYLKFNSDISLSLKGIKVRWSVFQKYLVSRNTVGAHAGDRIADESGNECDSHLFFRRRRWRYSESILSCRSFVFMPVIGLNNGWFPSRHIITGQKKGPPFKTVKLSIIYAVCIMVIGLIIAQLIPEKLLGIFNASDDMSADGRLRAENHQHSFSDRRDFHHLCLPSFRRWARGCTVCRFPSRARSWYSCLWPFSFRESAA